MSVPYLGSCYCGAIEISLADELDGGVLCHCITCQKLHTQNSYNVQTTLDKLSFTKGTPKIFVDDKAHSGSAVRRHFCGDCGSYIASEPDSIPGVVFVKVGILDRASEIKPKAEIYVEAALGHAVLPRGTGAKHFEGMMAKEVH